MIGKTPPGADPELEARARLIAVSALMVLALIAFMLVIGAPRPPQGASAPGLDAGDLARFRGDPGACISELRLAGIGLEPVPDKRESGACFYRDAVELTRSLHPYSQPVASSCALAAALVVWERDVLIPVAERRLGARVARIELAAPAYQCRPVAGRADRRMSEHANANAIDISGFTLVNGRVISVAQGWRGRPVERQFLREVRNGACGVFQAVLSPDYNAAHRDHLHFDLGRDKVCR